MKASTAMPPITGPATHALLDDELDLFCGGDVGVVVELEVGEDMEDEGDGDAELEEDELLDDVDEGELDEEEDEAVDLLVNEHAFIEQRLTRCRACRGDVAEDCYCRPSTPLLHRSNLLYYPQY